MPVTTIRPLVVANCSTARSKDPSKVSASADRASASIRSTRRPASKGALDRPALSTLFGNAMTAISGSWVTLFGQWAAALAAAHHSRRGAPPPASPCPVRCSIPQLLFADAVASITMVDAASTWRARSARLIAAREPRQ